MNSLFLNLLLAGFTLASSFANNLEEGNSETSIKNPESNDNENSKNPLQEEKPKKEKNKKVDKKNEENVDEDEKEKK